MTTSDRRCHPLGVRRSKQRSVLALLAVALLLTAGCTGDDKGTTTTSDPAPSTNPPTTAAQGPPVGAVETGWSDLEVGSCFDPIDDPAADDLAVWSIACELPHRYEVFDIFEYTGEGAGGTAYPGVAVVQNGAEEQCFSRFESFVGTRWTLSELDIAVWWPSEDSWARGDGSVICAVVDNTGRRLEGTQRASNR